MAMIAQDCPTGGHKKRGDYVASPNPYPFTYFHPTGNSSPEVGIRSGFFLGDKTKGPNCLDSYYLAYDAGTYQNEPASNDPPVTGAMSLVKISRKLAFPAAALGPMKA